MCVCVCVTESFCCTREITQQCKSTMCAVLSHSVMSDSLWPHGLQPTRLLCPWDSPGKNTGVGCHALLQGIFPTQWSNWGLLHCRQILYQLSHQRSPNQPYFNKLGALWWPRGMGGRLKREGIYIYLQLIHVIWQKPIQHCKAIILQLKINLKNT